MELLGWNDSMNSKIMCKHLEIATFQAVTWILTTPSWPLGQVPTASVENAPTRECFQHDPTANCCLGKYPWIFEWEAGNNMNKARAGAVLEAQQQR